ncbi:MAG: hypothetical protein KGL39_21355 [Patescibacteria group bacterium]|nr:hypothetical protein [Patescibacteria group bacterium]
MSELVPSPMPLLRVESPPPRWDGSPPGVTRGIRSQDLATIADCRRYQRQEAEWAATERRALSALHDLHRQRIHARWTAGGFTEMNTVSFPRRQARRRSGSGSGSASVDRVDAVDPSDLYE